MLDTIIPITDLRKNFGAIIDRLAYVAHLILTKGGEPFAILKAVPNVKRKFMKKSRGAWKRTTLDTDSLWKEVSKKTSKKSEMLFLLRE